ncbi:MAG: EAL domain-containing protein [Gammaproteobacteria bacterium]
MLTDSIHQATGCKHCIDQDSLGFEISMAFQPIVDTASKTIFAHEALVRGPNGEPAGTIFAQVNDDNRYRFDQTCRVTAIELAARLKISTYLHINFMPNAVYSPERCIRTTLEAAERFGFPPTRIVFEITEGEKITDHDHLRHIIQHYQNIGFLTAIDDFGAGYSGLNLLADFQTDLVKLDMALVRNIHDDPIRESIVEGIVGVCKKLNIRVIAEGVETEAELEALQRLNIALFQGYYFARPAFESIATPEGFTSA